MHLIIRSTYRLLFGAICSLLLVSAQSYVYSSSNVLTCTESDREKLNNCDEKLVVVMALQSGEESSKLTAQVTEATKGGVTQEMKTQVNIQCEVKPLISNFFLTERLIAPYSIDEAIDSYSMIPGFTCSTGLDDSTPSCPHLGGAPSGFCCDCSLLGSVQIIDELNRAKQACSVTSASFSHCFKSSSIFFSGFRASSTQHNAEAVCKVWEGDIDIAEVAEDDIVEASISSLSTADVVETASGNAVRFRIITESIKPNFPYGFDDKYIFAPRAQETDYIYPIVVPEEFVTLTGECDKIGVSSETFAYQSHACGRSSGSCLDNQIIDFISQDAVSKQQNKPLKYSLSAAYGLPGLSFTDNLDPFLHYEAIGSASYSIAVEMKAKELIVHNSCMSGEIKTASVSPFENGNTVGKVTALINNLGTKKANFSLSFSSCSEGVRAPPMGVAQIRPGITTTMNFFLIAALAQPRECSCVLELRDACAELVDSKVIKFTPEKNTGVVTPGGGQDPGGTSATPWKAGSCLSTCGAFGVLCLVKNQCWDHLTVVIGAPLTLIYMWWKIWRCRRKHRPKGSKKNDRHRKNSYGRNNAFSETETESVSQCEYSDDFFGPGVQTMPNIHTYRPAPLEPDPEAIERSMRVLAASLPNLVPNQAALGPQHQHQGLENLMAEMEMYKRKCEELEAMLRVHLDRQQTVLSVTMPQLVARKQNSPPPPLPSNIAQSLPSLPRAARLEQGEDKRDSVPENVDKEKEDEQRDCRGKRVPPPLPPRPKHFGRSLGSLHRRGSSTVPSSNIISGVSLTDEPPRPTWEKEKVEVTVNEGFDAKSIEEVLQELPSSKPIFPALSLDECDDDEDCFDTRYMLDGSGFGGFCDSYVGSSSETE